VCGHSFCKNCVNKLYPQGAGSPFVMYDDLCDFGGEDAIRAEEVKADNSESIEEGEEQSEEEENALGMSKGKCPLCRNKNTPPWNRLA
jgi:hypothetical protein